MIIYTSEEEYSMIFKIGNIKVYQNLILLFTNMKHFGTNIYKYCGNNYLANLFNSGDTCLINLCEECCNFLETGNLNSTIL